MHWTSFIYIFRITYVYLYVYLYVHIYICLYNNNLKIEVMNLRENKTGMHRKGSWKERERRKQYNYSLIQEKEKGNKLTYVENL